MAHPAAPKDKVLHLGLSTSAISLNRYERVGCISRPLTRARLHRRTKLDYRNSVGRKATQIACRH
jgi:hypothetical protein